MTDPVPPTPQAPRPARSPRKGELVVARVEGFDPRGRGLARVEEGGGLLHVRHAPLGARVSLEVMGKRRKKREARLVEVLDPGPAAAQARCAHFGSCGGCSWQSTAYAAQLAEMERNLAATLAAAGIVDAPLAPIVGAQDPWRYRNKMDFTFGNRRWVELDEEEGAERDFALGLHVPGRWDKVLDVEACPIQFTAGDGLLASARELARALSLEPWDVRSHEGLLRHLVLRHGVHTGEVLVYLVTSRAEHARLEPWVRGLLERHPEVTTLVQSVSARAAAVAQGEEPRIWHGPGFIREQLLGTTFEVSPESFFQTNTLQAERLFEIVREEARADGAEVWDLCCGAGVIGILLAPGAASVWGVDTVPSAVADAARNASANGIDNARFEVRDVLEALESGAPAAAEVVVLDPPRAGLHPKVVPALLRHAPARVVYVSCNVRSAAEDLARLTAPEGGFRLSAARPVDLFPHTPHVECVFTLERS